MAESLPGAILIALAVFGLWFLAEWVIGFMWRLLREAWWERWMG